MALYIEHVFPPIPAQLVLPVAGFLIGRGDLNFGGVLFFACLGGVLGSSTLYLLGYWVHEPIIVRYGHILKLTPERLEKTMDFIKRYSNSMVFVSHTIPLSPIRVLVSLLSGANKMPYLRFLFFTTLGTFLWIGGQLYVAVFIGQNWEAIFGIVQQQPFYFAGVALTVVAVLGIWYGWRWRSRKAHPVSVV